MKVKNTKTLTPNPPPLEGLGGGGHHVFKSSRIVHGNLLWILVIYYSSILLFLIRIRVLLDFCLESRWGQGLHGETDPIRSLMYADDIKSSHKDFL